MITLESLMALVSFALTCFGLGYSIGRNSRTKK